MQQTTNSAPQRTADSRHTLSTDGNAPAINYGAVIPGLGWLFRWLDRHNPEIQSVSEITEL